MLPVRMTSKKPIMMIWEEDNRIFRCCVYFIFTSASFLNNSLYYLNYLPFRLKFVLRIFRFALRLYKDVIQFIQNIIFFCHDYHRITCLYAAASIRDDNFLSPDDGSN